MAQTKLEKDIETASAKVSELTARRNQLRAEDQTIYERLVAAREQLNEAEISLRLGDVKQSAVDVATEKFEELLESQTEIKKELNLLDEAVKRATTRHNSLKQEHRAFVRKKLIENLDDAEKLKHDLETAAIRFLISLEITSGLPTSAGNIGRLLEQAVLNEGLSSRGGSNRHAFLKKMNDYRNEILGAAA